jgi:hypothetical protein
MNTHIIQGNVVVNTIVATPEEAQAAFPDAICIEATTGGIGWLWDGSTISVPPAPPALPPTIDDFTTALTAHLDATAQTRRYDNRITCMVRAGFAGPFQAEAIAFATWCDDCNMTAYQLLAEVQAGTRPMPETTQALIDVMPAMVWPT